MNHIPVSNMAFNTVNKIMDKYEPNIPHTLSTTSCPSTNLSSKGPL
jgi:hypothetical protein